MNDGATLQSWQMTLDGWRHIDDDEAHREEAWRTHVGDIGHRPLYMLPVELVPGSSHMFKLVCTEGSYDEHGLVTYPRRVHQAALILPASGPGA